MLNPPLLDLQIGIEYVFYPILGIVLLSAVVVVEGATLWRMNWGSFLPSIGTSLLVNLISTIVGVHAALNVSIPFRLWPPSYQIKVLPFYILVWILSALVETPALWVVKRGSLRIVLRISLLINGVSYLFLLLVTLPYALIWPGVGAP